VDADSIYYIHIAFYFVYNIALESRCTVYSSAAVEE
jgi:hypothetical protein